MFESNSPIVERKKPLDNLQGLKLFFLWRLTRGEQTRRRSLLIYS
uniref:Uncharacterized protein n=1 Tax=Siphoviridae sp. ctEJG5 TaxID=2827814 RepID=A0A8S5RX67_9CAUD|nr:MAG TPA: hypothetical protein [Siphoviridae sp. ctEJG5]